MKCGVFSVLSSVLWVIYKINFKKKSCGVALGCEGRIQVNFFPQSPQLLLASLPAAFALSFCMVTCGHVLMKLYF